MKNICSPSLRSNSLIVSKLRGILKGTAKSSSILLVGVGFFSIFILKSCSKKETHDEHSNVNPALPAGSGAVVIFNDMNFQIVEDSTKTLTAIAATKYAGVATYAAVGDGIMKWSSDGTTWYNSLSGIAPAGLIGVYVDKSSGGT